MLKPAFDELGQVATRRDNQVGPPGALSVPERSELIVRMHSPQGETVSLVTSRDGAEGKTIEPGTGPVEFDAPCGKVGLSVCYDLRFPALYRALAMAYDFAVAARRVPDDYAEILDDAGVKAQARAPMTPIVKLVFGADYDKTRLTEFAAALANATREGVDFGGFEAFLEAADGGLKGLVAAERKARRPDRVEVDRAALARTALRRAAPIALAQLPTNEEFALVLTRRNPNGIHEIVELVSDAALIPTASALRIWSCIKAISGEMTKAVPSSASAGSW